MLSFSKHLKKKKTIRSNNKNNSTMTRKHCPSSKRGNASA